MKRRRKPHYDADIADDDKQQFGLPSIGIPAEVLFNSELTTTEKILFGFIRNLSYTEKGCWASNHYLGKLIGVGKDTISNGVSNLSKHDYLIVEFFRFSNGNTGRRIFINPEYPVLYTNFLREVYENFYTPLRKSLYPYTKKTDGKSILKEDKEEDIVGGKPSNDVPPPRKIISKESRNEKFLPLAQYLHEIISTSKKIKYNANQIKSWADEIRKLSEMHTIDPVRIKRALRWYKSNVGGQYIPVIESGYSLRMKFIALEAAKTRQENPWEDKKKNEEMPDKTQTVDQMRQKMLEEMSPEEKAYNIEKYGTATPWFDKKKK